MFTNLKVVRTDSELECPVIDETLRNEGAELVLLPDNVSEAGLITAVRDADILLMCYTPVTRKVIESATRLRGIVKYGVGIDAIDIQAATEHKVSVANVPEYAENTVAEGAFCLLLALVKRLLPIDRAMHTQGWVWPNATWRGNDLHGKTLGLVGTGRIGSSMARIAGAGFGVNVLGYDPAVSAGGMREYGIHKEDNLHDLLAQSDFVSLHAVLNDSSSNMIGAAEFDSMRNGAIFINVSRGALVDESALLESLQNGKLAGAGLDVYRNEPLQRKQHQLSELYEMENVILSPHLTFFTDEAMQRLESETLDRCRELAEGKRLTILSSDPRLRAQSTELCVF